MEYTGCLDKPFCKGISDEFIFVCCVIYDLNNVLRTEHKTQEMRDDLLEKNA